MRDSSVLRMVSRHCCLEERPGRQDRVGAEAVEQLQHAALAEPAAGQHRADVAPEDVGEARVAQEDAERLVVQHALAVDAHGRDDDALVEDLGGVGRDAARPHAADVPEVAPRLREGDELAAVEHRRGEHHVRRVGDAAARAVAVVVPVEVAGAHRGGRVLLEDDLGEVAEERHHRAAHHAPARIEDAGEVVVLLADERRHRRALDDRFHVRLGRAQRAANDLARHRVRGQQAPRRAGPARPLHRPRPPARITRLPARSTVARCPGGTTVVASSCSTIAGPVTAAPAPSRSRVEARAGLPAGAGEEDAPPGRAACGPDGAARGTGCGSAGRGRRRPRAA